MVARKFDTLSLNSSQVLCTRAPLLINLHGGLLLVEVVGVQGGIAKVGLGVQDGLHLLQQLLQIFRGD